MNKSMGAALRIALEDTVAVALRDLPAGERVLGVRLTRDVPAGHKFALGEIAVGESVIKYGAPIGRATRAILAGGHVHTHNLKTLLDGQLSYTYIR